MPILYVIGAIPARCHETVVSQLLIIPLYLFSGIISVELS